MAEPLCRIMSLLNALFLLILTAVPVLLWRKYKVSQSSYRNLSLPPGPKPWPLIGNALDVPSLYPWHTFAQWGQKYGDVVHIHVLGQSIIILNSAEAASDLMEKRSANYSDRLQTEMMKLMGVDWNTAVMRYGSEWRQHRRTFHQFFSQSAVQAFRPQFCEAARDLLRRLHREPAGFIRHIKYSFGASMLSIMYGIKAAEEEDRYIAMANRALEASSEAFTPGAFWVDFVPALRYIPAWVPGADFQRKAARWLLDQLAVREEPWRAMVKEVPSISLKILERISDTDDTAYAEGERIAKCITAAAYEGGADTTSSTVTSFFLAMARYPEVQKRAQEELARVVGPTRLPDFSDRPSLTYINALCKECLRWQPVTPLGFGHRSLNDDEYRGYFIPGGALVVHNTWAILHNPEEYPFPEEFQPERFIKDGQLNPEVRDPATIAFGSGRRMCPGRHFGDMSLFINLASVLHTFDITPVTDDQGNLVVPEPKMMSGSLSHPVPFKCDIKPRSPLAEALILGQVL
ncbi:hypothetical protein CERSUDRAFT_112052 [Gelatoporia subvermispora B]|uniref:Cytochrome P450 n=1 Tax=Ceriporiopsis subvermispora (strain B) TaxID=914234 RepID=M2RLN9_CERS8|nr:hypothetical protein CERSUDRAFT_112052 [Gelatoporia subvermispora B]